MIGALGALAIVALWGPFERLEAPGVENLFRVGRGTYSGGGPQGEKGLAALAKLGIKTIVSVDGAAPEAALAKRLGMRYVHVPVGYDGIGPESSLAILKAARELPGPLYVHCHHGKHRGPAAAALVGLANEGWDKTQALAWMRAAGTSPDYSGLYETVERFVVPTEAQLRAAKVDLPEVARVPDFVASMVEVDVRWDLLKAVRAAGGKAPSRSPDVVPDREATLLAELYREAARLDESKERGAEFLARLVAAESNARDLARALKEGKELEGAFRRAESDCKACHVRHRDHR